MALSEIYVDPSIAADSGTGTIGDPFGDLEFGIEQTTFDATNGTRVNVKAGTDEILVAELGDAMDDVGTSIAWAPTETAPMIIQGYTTTAGDGGQGGISGGGSVSVFDDAAKDNISLIDLHMHNCGAATVINLDNFINVINCDVDNTTGSGISIDAFGFVASCFVTNIGGIGIEVAASSSVAYQNFLENGTNDFASAITVGGNAFAQRNIISVDGASDGIVMGSDGANVSHNSIFSAAGTGQGILAGTNTIIINLTNNLVEGFSGAGGVGIDLNASNVQIVRYGGNAVFDCETEYTAPSGYTVQNLGDNETLTVSPFTSAATGDFNPVDTGNVKEGALPAGWNES